MEKDFYFTLEENNKIQLSRFIVNLFESYSSLHTINLFKNTVSLIEKGKFKEKKVLINLSASFKYSSFYCYCYGNKVKTFEKEEDLLLSNTFLSNTFQDYIPISFYLKNLNKKITYQQFEKEILQQFENLNLSIECAFGDKSLLSFSKNNINFDVKEFLGSFIVSKQYAQSFDKELILKNSVDKKCIKI